MYYIVSEAGGELPVDRAVQSLKVFTNCLYDIREKGVISITGVWDTGGVNGTPSIAQAYAMGKSC